MNIVTVKKVETALVHSGDSTLFCIDFKSLPPPHPPGLHRLFFFFFSFDHLATALAYGFFVCSIWILSEIVIGCNSFIPSVFLICSTIILNGTSITPFVILWNTNLVEIELSSLCLPWSLLSSSTSVSKENIGTEEYLCRDNLFSRSCYNY